MMSRRMVVQLLEKPYAGRLTRRVAAPRKTTNDVRRRNLTVIATPDVATTTATGEQREGPSTDPKVIWGRLQTLALPYWTDPEVGGRAKWRLAGVVALTLATTGVSVGFNFIGRDFFNALSEKNVEAFTSQLIKYLAAFVVGIPVFVFRGYFQSVLSTDWREWMTEKFLNDYLENRTFYKVQATAAIDNPDQRISVDVQEFTGTALGFVLAILNAVIDLVSFSEILFSIYPPLFLALVVYAVGGTWISIRIGRNLVGLNFTQESREADFRFGLVRLRENAESVAFYSGESTEQNILKQRFGRAISNYRNLLVSSRNLDFFTSFYRYLIMLLPAAVVAPIFFKGEIGFGVVTQSQSAFSHILNDVSLVVYQFEALAGFSAVIDRLGEFSEAVEQMKTNPEESQNASVQLHTRSPPQTADDPVLHIDHLTLVTPDIQSTLITDLHLQLFQKDTLLVMGPSGAGKTSLLRAIAGLWTSGRGAITRYGEPLGANNQNGSIMFIPQKPYLVLGTLRDQLLYPTWVKSTSDIDKKDSRPVPDDLELEKAMLSVNLDDVLRRCRKGESALDTVADWSSQLSVGEQQRLAFARVLLSSPRFILMDESTSALDITNEAAMYQLLINAGTSYISVGHRQSLREFHSQALYLSPVEEGQWLLSEIRPSGTVV